DDGARCDSARRRMSATRAGAAKNCAALGNHWRRALELAAPGGTSRNSYRAIAHRPAACKIRTGARGYAPPAFVNVGGPVSLIAHDHGAMNAHQIHSPAEHGPAAVHAAE